MVEKNPKSRFHLLFLTQHHFDSSHPDDSNRHATGGKYIVVIVRRRDDCAPPCGSVADVQEYAFFQICNYVDGTSPLNYAIGPLEDSHRNQPAWVERAQVIVERYVAYDFGCHNGRG
jgi:hypothetical protein